MRSIKTGSAECRSSNTRTTGLELASVSSSLRMAHAICSEDAALSPSPTAVQMSFATLSESGSPESSSAIRARARSAVSSSRAPIACWTASASGQ